MRCVDVLVLVLALAGLSMAGVAVPRIAEFELPVRALIVLAVVRFYSLHPSTPGHAGAAAVKSGGASCSCSCRFAAPPTACSCRKDICEGQPVGQ
jgi:hypothetical protein